MGEGRTGEPTGEPRENQRLTVTQAAATLGITEGAVRSRIKRGTLPTIREDGAVFVLWGDGTSQANQPTNTGVPSAQSERVGDLQEQVAYFREQLDRERGARTEERRRQDTIIAQLSAANAEQARIIRQLEPPSPAPSVLRGSVEEGGKETARRIVGLAVAGFVGAPSLLASLNSILFNPNVLALLTAFFGIVTALVGTYFAVKTSSDAREGAQRVAGEANTTAEQAAQEAQEAQREGD